MIDFHSKMNRLRRLEDAAIFRWTGGHKRIADDYILLSNLRLNTISCSQGRVFYSSAAAVVYNVHGRPVISFRDRDLLTVFPDALQELLLLRRGKLQNTMKLQ